jgi:hypothetical protein
MHTVMRQSLVFAAFVSVVAGSVTAGCGNSSNGNSTTTTTSSGSTSTGTSTSSGPHDSGTGDAIADSGPATPVLTCTFDTAAQECSVPAGAPSWSLNAFASPSNLAYVNPEAGAPEGGDAGDAGDAAVSGSLPTLTVSTADGNPTPGALQLTATFTASGQFVEPILPLAAVDMSGKTLSADVRLVSLSGGATSFDGGVQLYVDTTPTVYCYTSVAMLSTFAVGTWRTISANVSTAAAAATGCTSDPTQIIQVGLHFYTNAAATDGAAFAPVTAVFEIDNVIAQ